MIMAAEPWASLNREDAFSSIQGRLWRLVESQEQVATNRLVSSMDESAVLEQLLEGRKPPYPAGTERLHYLLATPFRYPPLPWGSRFGLEWEPGIFYGSCDLQTAQAETAYYRLRFWQGMSVPPPSGVLITQHDSFSADYACPTGARLQNPPWAQWQASLTHRSDYSTSQAAGSWLRQQGAQGFEFESARCPQKGINVALFKPEGLHSETPLEMQPWLCETRADSVAFSSRSSRRGIDVVRWTTADIPL
ncbi:RES family NAD+ phosphorylase [Perlucidibaca aquatica]|uniref:RES family NAD+ phosphorylase n=1 Tax=Perlucidibaca aquatica TaxID=1852776 RepID=UPI0009ECF55D|nr:RES family NAD+ phosphorylase [Perlucidibaca aquatica]